MRPGGRCLCPMEGDRYPRFDATRSGYSPQRADCQISEQLLDDFAQVALLDKYDVYEVLMEYWAETMQDDVYALCYDGYEAGREIAYEYVTKKKRENGQTIEVKTDKIKGFEGKLFPKL